MGFLVSYDYEMLKVSLPLIYASADSITLAVDCNNKTWSGLDFDIPAHFYDWLRQADVDQKIEIYKDDFYQSSLSVMENDTRERNMLSKYMGAGGWHIQIDTDEYFLEFEQFVHFLRNEVDKVTKGLNEPVSVYVKWVSLFKKVEGGYLIVTSFEDVPIATRHPVYKYARFNEHRRLFTDFSMLHQSWARGRSEIQEKLNSWSHKDDFNTDSYFRFWDVCDQHNSSFYHNFHPLVPENWAGLRFISAKSITTLIGHYVEEEVTKSKHQPNRKRISDLPNRLKNNFWKRYFKFLTDFSKHEDVQGRKLKKPLNRLFNGFFK